jgi:hypothetical protein
VHRHLQVCESASINTCINTCICTSCTISTHACTYISSYPCAVSRRVNVRMLRKRTHTWTHTQTSSATVTQCPHQNTRESCCACNIHTTVHTTTRPMLSMPARGLSPLSSVCLHNADLRARAHVHEQVPVGDTASGLVLYSFSVLCAGADALLPDPRTSFMRH